MPPAAREFGERAARALTTPAAVPIVREGCAQSYLREGRVAAEAWLQSKVAFDRAYDAWRAATRALATAGATHFGRHWPTVADDMHRDPLVAPEREDEPRS